VADDFDSWAPALRLGTESADSKARRLFLARGDRLRLVAEGQVGLEQLQLLAEADLPGVLVATASAGPVETVERLVDAAWVAVVDGQACIVICWDAIGPDGTVFRPVGDSLVPTPAITPERLTRVVSILGRPGGTVADADDALEDWRLPDCLRPGAMRPRGDRVIKNARWFLTDGRRVRGVTGGDASLSDLTELAGAVPANLAFVATGEEVVFWDPPLVTVEELASEAWVAVFAEQVHRVVNTPSQIDKDGRTWVRTGYRYARKQVRLISTGDAHLLAITPEQLLERVRSLPHDEVSPGVSTSGPTAG
jgi:hypothetical protein